VPNGLMPRQKGMLHDEFFLVHGQTNFDGLLCHLMDLSIKLTRQKQFDYVLAHKSVLIIAYYGSAHDANQNLL
jgi:hypothetical protein